MDPQTALTNIIIRKGAWYVYGWVAQTAYNRAFKVYWERQANERDKVNSDWKWIMRKAANTPAPIYVSAGDLFFMAPLLEEINSTPQLRTCINRICVKRISDDLFAHLTESKEFLPVVSKTLLDMCNANIDRLKKQFSVPVDVQQWSKLPPFAGALYRDYLMYHPWEVDTSGCLSHRGNMRFMHRENDPESFDTYKAVLTEGF